MLAAAQIAGLNVLSLMHDSTAFAFKYGFDNEAVFAKEKEPTNVVFYDLGATSYKARPPPHPPRPPHPPSPLPGRARRLGV